MENPDPSSAAIGVIGGSGLYEIDALENPQEYDVETPYGPPSDLIVGGTLQGRTVYFLSRHGRGHRLAPHEINHRANIYALRTLGVRWLICVTSVGSLQERYAPQEIVLPSQLYDRMSGREKHTFFGNGIVAHVSLAEPICGHLRTLLAQVCSSLRKPYHSGGTYVCIDGPAYSTRAESERYRHAGYDVIGMTNVPEAKLAREAEIAMATLAMVTDYDCWKGGEDSVSAQAVLTHLKANAETAKEIIAKVVTRIPTEPNWPEHHALAGAIVTPREYWPQETLDKLRLLLDRFP